MPKFEKKKKTASSGSISGSLGVGDPQKLLFDLQKLMSKSLGPPILLSHNLPFIN